MSGEQSPRTLRCDVVLPRMLQACSVRSDHVYARVSAVARAAARGTPQAEAVLTAADLPPVALSSSRHADLLLTAQPVLAGDRVRLVAEAVGIVEAVRQSHRTWVR